MRAIITGPTLIDAFDPNATYPAGTQVEMDVLCEDPDYGYHHCLCLTPLEAVLVHGAEERRGNIITRAQVFVPATQTVEGRAA